MKYEIRNAYIILVGKPKGDVSHGIRRRWRRTDVLVRLLRAPTSQPFTSYSHLCFVALKLFCLSQFRHWCSAEGVPTSGCYCVSHFEQKCYRYQHTATCQPLHRFGHFNDSNILHRTSRHFATCVAHEGLQAREELLQRITECADCVRRGDEVIRKATNPLWCTHKYAYRTLEAMFNSNQGKTTENWCLVIASDPDRWFCSMLQHDYFNQHK